MRLGKGAAHKVPDALQCRSAVLEERREVGVRAEVSNGGLRARRGHHTHGPLTEPLGIRVHFGEEVGKRVVCAALPHHSRVGYTRVIAVSVFMHVTKSSSSAVWAFSGARARGTGAAAGTSLGGARGEELLPRARMAMRVTHEVLHAWVMEAVMEERKGMRTKGAKRRRGSTWAEGAAGRAHHGQEHSTAAGQRHFVLLLLLRAVLLSTGSPTTTTMMMMAPLGLGLLLLHLGLGEHATQEVPHVNIDDERARRGAERRTIDEHLLNFLQEMTLGMEQGHHNTDHGMARVMLSKALACARESFALFAEVKVSALETLPADAADGIGLASVARDACVDRGHREREGHRGSGRGRAWACGGRRSGGGGRSGSRGRGRSGCSRERSGRGHRGARLKADLQLERLSGGCSQLDCVGELRVGSEGDPVAFLVLITVLELRVGRRR